jgi:TRAP-type C4-dicarboxylate transport system permease small subunit
MESRLRLILALIDRLASALAFLCGAGVLVLSLLITWDIVARKVFGVSVQGTDELGGYTLALIGSLGMAHVLQRREFTRIDLAFPYLPARLRQVLHVLAHVALAGTVVFFAYRATLTLQETLLFDSVANTPLQTPLWIPQGLWVVGLTLFAVVAVLHAVRSLFLLVLEPHRVEHEYGCAGARDEVDAFMSDADPAAGRQP